MASKLIRDACCLHCLPIFVFTSGNTAPLPLYTHPTHNYSQILLTFNLFVHVHHSSSLYLTYSHFLLRRRLTFLNKQRPAAHSHRHDCSTEMTVSQTCRSPTYQTCLCLPTTKFSITSTLLGFHHHQCLESVFVSDAYHLRL